MKRILLTLVICQFSFVSFAQEWIRYYGYGQQPFASYCFEQYDKGYILLGDINNYKYGWIVKTDINGSKLWDIKIGDGINETMPSNIEQTYDHGFILCGTTSMYNFPHKDPFILKLNSCGEKEWCKVLVLDNTNDGGYNVKQTTDGGFVLLAELYGNDPNDRIHLFKFDSQGELFWHKIYNRDSLVFGEIIRSLYVDSANFLITAFCYYPNWMKPYFIQTDTAGNETWRLVYSQHTGLGYVGDVWATVRDKHGNYYSAGRRENSSELIKFSSGGNEMMNVDLFPTAQSGASRTILLLTDTTCILDASWSLNGSTNYFGVVKTDTLGIIKAIKYLPDPDNSGATWSAKTFNDNILLIGMNLIGANSRIVLFKVNSNLQYDSVYNRPFTYDSLCPETIVSHTINPNCDVLVSADEPFIKPETATLKIYPNPANQKIEVEFPKYIVVKTAQAGFGSATVYHQWKSSILEVYDFSGREVLAKEIFHSQPSMEIDASSWPRGIYHFRLVYHNRMVAGEKVVVN